MKKWVKVTLVIFGALIVTALGIDAADTLTGKSGTLLSSVLTGTDSCGNGMISVGAVPGVRCVDIYEVSTNDTCPIREPKSALESHKNVETSDCIPLSLEKKTPWTFVTRDQAMQLCARVGKRLPSSSEWYALTLGMSDVDASCNVSTNAVLQTGMSPRCMTPSGAYDFVGNVWEWVADDVVDGAYNNRQLPQNGYVTQIDNTGVAVLTSPTEDELMGEDYFWTQQTGVFGMIRGGFYGSDEDAGLYSIHADTPPTTASVGIGFRCVK